MNTDKWRSDFARRYISEGRAEGLRLGLAKGRAEILLKQLTLRFGPLTADNQALIFRLEDVELNAVAERVLTAQTLEEALGR